MLTIIKRMSAVLCRPKYHPTSRHAQWCVYDSDKKLTVYGPETRTACQRYIDEVNTMPATGSGANSAQKNTGNNVAVEFDDGVTEFPMIMQNPDSGTVFLITGKKHTGAFIGFILADGTSKPSEMGRFSDHWKKKLIPFTGAITLSNKKS